MGKSLEYFSTDSFKKSIKFGSTSASDANRRLVVFDKVMENVENVRETAKKLGLFSASSDIAGSQMGVALKELSFKAILDSFSGYVAIERPLSQMRELLVYRDMITKGAGKVALPFIGKPDLEELAGNRVKTHTFTASGTPELETGVKLVPGSIKFEATVSGKTYVITDDRNGTLIAAPGILTSGTVNYVSGKIAAAFATAPTGDIRVSYAKDELQEDANKRIRARENYFEIVASINKFEYEADLIQTAISTKSTGSDLLVDMKEAVQEEYRISINNKLVKCYKDNYSGNTLTINLSSYSVQAGMMDSLLQTFRSGLVSVDSALGKKCVKAVAATAYIVGLGLSDVFQSLEDDAFWVPNNTGYVDGLVGFYRGRAVLQHHALDEFEGYALHKVASGELAPVALGIFLPATDLPLIGNYNNTNEIAGGIYSVEGVSFLTDALVQKFVVSMPSDWMKVA